MNASLAGKVALVTGGSRGIGAAVCARLAADGADIALTYQRSADRAADLVRELESLGRRAYAVQADSTDAKAVRSAVEQARDHFGGLDILVNNAGTGAIAPIDELTPDQVDAVLETNVRGSFLFSQAVAPTMRDGGRIVTIGSCVARRVVLPGMTLYAMSKAAMVGLNKGLARELGSRGITANVVHPGPIDTDLNPADGPGSVDQMTPTAVGRFGEVSEVASAVAYLVGDEARYVTGAELDVDGGFVV